MNRKTFTAERRGRWEKQIEKYFSPTGLCGEPISLLLLLIENSLCVLRDLCGEN